MGTTHRIAAEIVWLRRRLAEALNAHQQGHHQWRRIRALCSRIRWREALLRARAKRLMSEERASA